MRYDNCKGCGNVNCEHYGKDREFVCPGGKSCKTENKPPFDENMYVVYTENRFNQVLISPTWNDAAEWCRSATTWNDAKIREAIKMTSWDNHSNFISVFQI